MVACAKLSAKGGLVGRHCEALIKHRRRPLNHAKCAAQAVPDARSGTVASRFVDDPQFPIHHSKGPLSAIGHAQSAAIALLFVDLDDVPE